MRLRVPTSAAIVSNINSILGCKTATAAATLFIFCQFSQIQIFVGSTQLTPTYRMNFNVTYSNKNQQFVSENCGKYYANTFLSNFVSVGPWLEKKCSDAALSCSVNIGQSAIVSLYSGKVHIVTHITIKTNRTLIPDGIAQVDRCAHLINASLQQVTVLEREAEAFSSYSHGSRMISSIQRSIQANSLCLNVSMDPMELTLALAKWVCSERYSVNDIHMVCCAENDTEERCVVRTNYSTLSPSQSPSNTGSQNHSSTLTPFHVTSSVDIKSSIEQTLSTSGPVDEIQNEVTPKDTSTTEFTKPWKVELLKNVSRVQVTEGDRVYDLSLKISINRTALCGSDDQNFTSCQLSVDVAFDDQASVQPVCRRTGEKMSQLVLSQSIVDDEVNSDNLCSLPLSPSNNNTGFPLFSQQLKLEDEEHQIHLYLKAVLDHKYDGEQIRNLSLSLRRKALKNGEEIAIDTPLETILELPVNIEDRDRKSTCQSINDPHITTFDGLEYNNYYEGEFILYRHRTLPFSIENEDGELDLVHMNQAFGTNSHLTLVHSIYQQCHPDTPASCNCGVAVQSGDDVIVFDRCFRQEPRGLPSIVHPEENSNPPFSVELFLNDDLTAGTRIFQDGDGMKYFVFLPHGAYVKVMTSEQLINVWVVPSPNDLYMTEGLCGSYDLNKGNDINLRNETISNEYEEQPRKFERLQPTDFIFDWRVEMNGSESLFQGMSPSLTPYTPTRYCQCRKNQDAAVCGYSVDINFCDIYQGKDVTDLFLERAVSPKLHGDRKKRDIEDNLVATDLTKYPILIRKDFKPPKHEWHQGWNDVIAKDYCQQHIQSNYSIGQLCSQIAAVNFKQEITTCTEDIKITGKTSWADSARDAMKEQCLEEAQKNSSLPKDIVDKIYNELCMNDCSGHGKCVNGSCKCDENYSLSDCSIALKSGPAPVVFVMPHYGLCDVRFMSCSSVIVHGNGFLDTPDLTCHLEECKVTDQTYFPLNNRATFKAIFIDFNAVECPVPEIKTYLISVSNNGYNKSKPLLFIPFDSACSSCNILNSTCVKKQNSCIIDGKCYRVGERSPSDHCLICLAVDEEYQWSTVKDGRCRNFQLSDWLVAVMAAITGSLIGIIVGFLLYKCCCRRKKLTSIDSNDQSLHRNSFPNHTIDYNDLMLHRNQSFPEFSTDPFTSQSLQLMDPEPNDLQLFSNDGSGLENGLDSTTYFYDDKGVENGVDSSTYF